MIFFLSMSLMVSCTSPLYTPEQGHATDTVSLQDLQKGRRLYVDNCAGCHSLILPEKYSGSEWKEWMNEMRPQVRINSEEEDLILKYLSRGSK